MTSVFSLIFSLLFSVFDNCFFLIFIRCLGFFSLWQIDTLFRGILSKLILAFLSAVYLRIIFTISANFTWTGAVSEYFSGLLLSVPFILLLELVVLFGELIDSGRGQQIASFYDYSIGVQQSSLATMLRWGTWGLVLASGIVELTLGHLYLSLVEIPLTSNGIEKLGQLAKGIIFYTSEVFSQAVWFTLPCLITFLLVDLGSGFMGKVMPQLSLQAESFQIKSALCFLMVVLGCNYGLSEVLSVSRLCEQAFMLFKL